jgi:hypothetical protein
MLVPQYPPHASASPHRPFFVNASIVSGFHLLQKYRLELFVFSLDCDARGVF